MGPSITLDNCSLSIAGNQILAPINAVLGAGQMHMLVGPNGAGKTSLLKSMLGLMPHKGHIERSWPAQSNGSNQPLRPAYIPQQPRFDQVLPVTIEDFLCAGLSRKPVFFRRKTKLLSQVDRLLLQVGLQGKAQLQLGQLSGGERQRLMFAQALSRPADLWFLDEPMTGLDSEGQTAITKLMLGLREQGKTLIVVHHDMEFVKAYADNVLLINGGLEAMGSMESVNFGQSAETTVASREIEAVA